MKKERANDDLAIMKLVERVGPGNTQSIEKETDRTSSYKARYLLTHYRLWDYMLKAFPVRFTALIRNLIYTDNTKRTVNQGWRDGLVKSTCSRGPQFSHAYQTAHNSNPNPTFNSSSRSDCPLPTSAI